MKKEQLAHLVLNKSHDLFWMIDAEFRLIHANNTYLNLIKTITGVEQNLNETVLVVGLGNGNIEKWKSYYKKAFEGTNVEFEKHFYPAASNVTQYSKYENLLLKTSWPSNPRFLNQQNEWWRNNWY